MINHFKTNKKKKPARSEDVAGSSRSAQSIVESSYRQRVVELEEFEYLVFHRFCSAERSSLLEPAIEITQISLEADQIGVIGFRPSRLDVAENFLHCRYHVLTPFWSRLSASQDCDDSFQFSTHDRAIIAQSLCPKYSIIGTWCQAKQKTGISAVFMA